MLGDVAICTAMDELLKLSGDLEEDPSLTPQLRLSALLVRIKEIRRSAEEGYY